MFSFLSSRSADLAGRWGWGAALVAVALYMPGLAGAQVPAAQYYGGIEYVTGGFGADESAALKAAMPDYPVAFTFAASDGQRAAFVSQVRLVVRDQYDATILNVESQGPFLLARLMPGKYLVHATYRNETQSRTITVADNRTTRVVFEWTRAEPASSGRQPGTSDEAADAGQDDRFQFRPGSIPGLD